MVPVSISRFYKNIVGAFDYVGIPQYRHIPVPQITRKYELDLASVFPHPQFHNGGAEQMPPVVKFHPYPVIYPDFFIVTDSFEQPDTVDGVPDGVQRPDRRKPCPFALAVHPFIFKLLYVAAVRQHYRTEFGSGLCGKYRTLESVDIQFRQPA